MEFQAVLDAVRAWPVDDQVRLVDLLQDDLLSQDADLTPELMRELDRRVANFEADPSIGIPWDKFEAHMDKRLKELGE